MNLDFSSLTDDQLVELLRATLNECVQRNPAVQAAAQSAIIDEKEKAEIAKQAAEQEAAKLRAQERERIAKEAAERVRRENEERDRVQQAKRKEQEVAKAAENAAKAASEALEKDEREKEWLRRAGQLVGVDPWNVTISYFQSSYGVRVVINLGEESRFDRDHLVDWNAKTNKIKAKRQLIGKKPELIRFCVEFREFHRPNFAAIQAIDYHWEERTE